MEQKKGKNRTKELPFLVSVSHSLDGGGGYFKSRFERQILEKRKEEERRTGNAMTHRRPWHHEVSRGN